MEAMENASRLQVIHEASWNMRTQSSLRNKTPMRCRQCRSSITLMLGVIVRGVSGAHCLKG
eukprot:5417621-Amphidinium_carterae.1